MVETALVTGSAGFLGRHFVGALRDRGYDVTEVDVVSDLPMSVSPIDAREFFREIDFMGSYDLVVHAAAFVGGRAGIESRRTFVGAYNLQLDGALFDWALRTHPKHVVYLSSSAVYPVRCQNDGTGTAMFEELVQPTTPRLPDETYGWVKLTGERLAREYADEGGVVHVVRPFSGYGADQDPLYPFPAFVGRVTSRADPFRIWGDGSQVRDWVHVDDVVGATLALVDHDVREPVNVCTGRGVSFDTLARLFFAEAGNGYSPHVTYATDLPSGVRYRVGDPTRLLRYYTPRVTLEEGIARALRGDA